METKSIFITGAANGIGRAAAKRFADNGWFVGAFDIDEKNLQALQNEIGKDKLHYGILDVTDEQAAAAAMKEFAKLGGGKIDALLSNAGIIVQKPFEEGTVSSYKKQIDVNAFGMVNVIHAALPYLKKSDAGRIVITSSSSAIFGIPNFAVYSATKGFLKNLTEALSTEFKKFNIEVSSVMPLFVQTNMMKSIDKKYKAEITPDDVAKLLYYAATKGRKRHYVIGKGLKFTKFLYRILPTKTFQKFLKNYLKYK